jgi:hypothetical protein
MVGKSIECGGRAGGRQEIPRPGNKVYRLIGSSAPDCAAMSMSKDTLKAIVIIVVALGVLCALLLFANHIRPHP